MRSFDVIEVGDGDCRLDVYDLSLGRLLLARFRENGLVLDLDICISVFCLHRSSSNISSHRGLGPLGKPTLPPPGGGLLLPILSVAYLDVGVDA